MKKITLLILIGVIPFFTLAQKRSKKDNEFSKNASYEFMILVGTEIFQSVTNASELSEKDLKLVKQKSLLNEGKMMIRLIFDNKSEESSQLSKIVSREKSLVRAVNRLAEFGWDFHSANIVSDESSKIHYYYMRRNK